MALPPITLRRNKGALLTNDEVDDNFVNLDERVKLLPETVAGVAPVDGDIPLADLQVQLDIPTTPADLGAATAAQGALADTAVQPDQLATALADKVTDAELATGLDGKVYKIAGKGLSEEDFTTVLRDKLIAVEPASFRGVFISYAAMVAGVVDPLPGNYADVDPGVGDPVQRYNWDDTDGEWQTGTGGGGPSSTDALPEGLTNLYFTTARVLATALTGLSVITGGPIISTDTVLSGLGKLQKQISDAAASLSSHIGSRGVANHLVANTTDPGFMPAMPASDDKQYLFKNGALVELVGGGSDLFFVESLIVAGGAAGGVNLGNSTGAGGGGGGGVLLDNVLVSVGFTFPVVVGAGGAAPAVAGNGVGGNGGNSTFGGKTAIGGGGGGAYTAGAYRDGASGGSGGGGAGSSKNGGAGTTGQGFAGGNGGASTVGGGGGGANEAGGNGLTGTTGGKGGNGIQLSFDGTPTYYGGGGGGGGLAGTTSNTGGLGGGGTGGIAATSGGGNGTNGLGGGGGGEGYGSSTTVGAGNGGSGVVKIRYLGAARATGGTITSSGGYTIHTFTASGNFVVTA